MSTHPIWEETVELPIGLPAGDGDDDGDPAEHRVATVRKMTGNEEALLADPKLRGNGAKLITVLLSNCVTSLNGHSPVEARHVRSLYSADRNFLLLQLRRLTFGDELECNYRCPRCANTVRVIEDLSTIEVRAAEDASEEIAVTLRDGYRDSNGESHFEMVFGLPTGEDEEAASNRKDHNASRQRDALLARCLRRAGSIEQRKLQAAGIRILADLATGDRRLIQKELDEKAPRAQR